MKKEYTLLLASLIITSLLFSSAYALSWNDFFGKITGNAVAPICTDSDNGTNIFINGSVTSGSRVFYDQCSGDKSVKEYYCLKSKAKSSNIKCPGGFICSNNVCVLVNAQEGRRCRDTDSGINFTSNGYVEACVGNRCQNFYDGCNSSTNIAADAYCTADNQVAYATAFCSSGCEQNGSSQCKVLNKNLPTSCTDTDGGMNFNVSGNTTVCVNSTAQCVNTPDFCTTGTNVLHEGTCSFGNNKYYLSVNAYNCPEGCANGACICTPKTCDDFPDKCGKLDDGCGKVIDCSNKCGTGYSCDLGEKKCKEVFSYNCASTKLIDPHFKLCNKTVCPEGYTYSKCNVIGPRSARMYQEVCVKNYTSSCSTTPACESGDAIVDKEYCYTIA